MSKGQPVIKRTVAAIVPILALATTLPLAQAAPAKHPLELTIKDVTINSQGDQVGDKQSTAGLISGNPFGRAVESTPAATSRSPALRPQTRRCSCLT
jgi:hypothetical protein